MITEKTYVTRGYPVSADSIVYLMGDQLKASAVGFMNNRYVTTPFMDSMASRGVTFTNAYAPSPICTPSRTSVFTGVHPLVHQVTCHVNRAPFNLSQLPELLSGKGYYTAVAGHYEPERNLNRGWHEQVSFREPGPLLASYLRLRHSGRRDVGWSAGGLDCPPEEGNSSLLTDRVLKMLDQAALAKRPFFLHVAYNDPHPPYFVAAPYDTLVDPAILPLPDQGETQARPVWQEKAMEECGTESGTEYDILKALTVYYGKIAYLDKQMQRVYEGLLTKGLLENTWIIISSDHGDYAGEKGLFTKTESLYECLLHVPLIIVPPSKYSFRKGVKIKTLMDLVDLFPTILRIAEVPVPFYTQGYDLITWLRKGTNVPLHKHVFSEVGDYHGGLKTTFPGGMPSIGRHQSLVMGVRTIDFSYVCDRDYGDEAYDLRHDPKELRNLLMAGATHMPPEIQELQSSLRKWEEQCIALREKLGVIPGYRGFEKGWESLSLSS